jgi:two-component system, response regulator YesN
VNDNSSGVGFIKRVGVMPYKVFFVEDEIVTREGIRDNVDWQASGFEFCGEAADGEMALPLLRTTQPDVLITDIKMPFMDGLQLSKLVRERMPWVKIVILSGHDEFEYAQEAINLGVTDYLLKPVTVEKLKDTLQKLATQLDQEKEEQKNLQKLQEQVDENRVALRERLLLKLVVGAISPAEAIERGHGLGLDLVARYYQVIIIKIELRDRSDQFDYEEYQHIQDIVSALTENDPDILLLKKDFDELILIIKGTTPEYLEDDRALLLNEISKEVTHTRYQLTSGTGTAQKRIADICQSFVEALVDIQRHAGGSEINANHAIERLDLLKVDKSAVENFLRSGARDEFDAFFDAYIQPLGESALKSNLLKNYMFLDVVLAAAKLVNDLGGEIDNIIPELNSIETVLSNIRTIEQLHEQSQKILSNTLVFRDSQCNDQYKNLIRQAKDYIDQHYNDPELSLNQVASQVNLSASHFSLVFGHENSQTFKEYLTKIRMDKAKEMLRTTALRSADIAYQVGYNDPHYFSSAFKKHTGLSPIEFRRHI